MPSAIMKLNLGACLTRPTKRAHRILEQTALDCDRARNAMLRYWLRWMEEHPDYEPQQRTDKTGRPKVTKQGKPVMESPGMPQCVQRDMTHYAGEKCPSLARKVIADCAKDVTAFLEARMPYNHDGPSRLKWEALLNYEISPASFRSRTIPTPKQDTPICYRGGIVADRQVSSGIRGRLLAVGESSAAARFVVFSRQSGYDHSDLMFRLNVDPLTSGQKRVLRNIVAGELPYCDSKLIGDDGVWTWYLSWKPPVDDLGLDTERTAVLRPLPWTDKSDKPFELVFPEGHRWTLGDAKPLRAEYERIVARRATLRAKYMHREGSRGHGKSRFYSKLRPYSRAVEHCVDLFCRNLRAEIIRGCQRHNCGRLEYREPTKPVRNHPAVWFNRYHIPFPWDVFGRNLSQKLDKHAFAMPRKGQQVKWNRLSMAKWKELIGDE